MAGIKDIPHLFTVKKLFYILTVILPLTIQAQNITISAKVRDIETGESLGFASVGIKGIPIGTISNDQGDFDFHFNEEYRNEILVVSMLGYKNYEAPVWTLVTGNTEIITLQKSPIILDEVVVSHTLTGGDILGIALSRIETNYPMKPFMLEGFYRDVKKVGGTYVSLLEAAVKIYDENYAAPRNKEKLRERVKLIEVRRSLGYESKFTTYFDQANLLENLLLQNTIRYRDFEATDELLASMSREVGSFYDGHEIYVVTHPALYHLRVYIDKVDFSIIHLEYETGPSTDELGKKKSMISKFAGLRKVIDFRRHDGKMYPSFISITSKVNWYDIKTNELKFETELFQQLLINKVSNEPTERIGSTQKMANYGLQYQDLPYNKEFWENYNVIKETPLDKKVIEDLEKLVPLEKQFGEN
jgi:hypothetical protein